MSKLTSLRRNDQFEKIKNEGRRLEEKGLEIFVLNNSISSSRLGIQVSSKIANSVTRNRVKRRIKEAAKFLEEEATIDIVVVVKKNGITLDFFTIKNILQKHPSL